MADALFVPAMAIYLLLVFAVGASAVVVADGDESQSLTFVWVCAVCWPLVLALYLVLCAIVAILDAVEGKRGERER